MINKKGESVIGGVVVFIMVILLLGFSCSYFDYKTNVKECEQYNSYGYFTEMNGDDWFAWSPSKCLITMEDETKLPLNDYKVMSIKNAKVKGDLE